MLTYTVYVYKKVNTNTALFTKKIKHNTAELHTVHPCAQLCYVQ